MNGNSFCLSEEDRPVKVTCEVNSHSCKQGIKNRRGASLLLRKKEDDEQQGRLSTSKEKENDVKEGTSLMFPLLQKEKPKKRSPCCLEATRAIASAATKRDKFRRSPMVVVIKHHQFCWHNMRLRHQHPTDRSPIAHTHTPPSSRHPQVEMSHIGRRLSTFLFEVTFAAIPQINGQDSTANPRRYSRCRPNLFSLCPRPAQRRNNNAKVHNDPGRRF